MHMLALISIGSVSMIFQTYGLKVKLCFLFAYSVIEKPPLDFDGRYN